MFFKGPLTSLTQILATKSPLKNNFKNYFHFTSKGVFIHKYVNVYLDFLVMHKNRLIKKVRLVSELVTYQPRKTIAIPILSNISRSKGS